ncbi:MAG: hypothetical protein ACLFQK_05895 [Fibrobacterota bacterium]
MLKTLIFFLILTAASLTAAPSNVSAFFRDGQTFITWTEDGSSTYDVYRHTEAITSGNIGSAVKIATVDDSSSNCKYKIGENIGQTHWIILAKNQRQRSRHTINRLRRPFRSYHEGILG